MNEHILETRQLKENYQTNNEQILKVESLKKKYHNQTVLQNINLSLNAHDVYALVGINGSGKTTLLSILSGLVHSDEGTIHIDKKIKKENPTGFAFQPTSLYPYLSGKDNIDLLSPRPSNAYEILNRLNQSEKILSKKVKKLSFGQKQRLGLSIALSKEANLYLLDEPTNGLDVASCKNLVEIIKDMASNGSAFIIASHEWDIIEQCCNRLGMIYNGTIRKELDTFQGISEVNLPIIQMKTLNPIRKEEIETIVDVFECVELDDQTWRLTISSEQSVQTVQQLLIMKNILIQEWINIKPVQEWENLYNQWVKEEDINARNI
ncbi:ABC transporter ATP-binding protein [Lysinibacillus agricola]|uniref:ABC transporter ATP-binding protein n=1 Tax=Lysinibacillus agricola TaxID=2590012 RepID=A0ABX7AWF4_9BACI|nr:ABC transporter ATP-binding protein [Lysinibacillus agricola]QQP12529.1 ABC transporter ATP-binding protein [Lysinibacillus agricola]